MFRSHPLEVTSISEKQCSSILEKWLCKKIFHKIYYLKKKHSFGYGYLNSNKLILGF